MTSPTLEECKRRSDARGSIFKFLQQLFKFRLLAVTIAAPDGSVLSGCRESEFWERATGSNLLKSMVGAQGIEPRTEHAS